MAGKGQPGPSSRLTKQVRQEIARKLVSGCTLEDAALAVGVRKRTILTWLAVGREAAALQEEGKRLTERQKNYLALYEAEQAARAELRVRLLTSIQAAASRGQYQAAAWLLERLFPDEFAPKGRGVKSRPGTGRPVGAASSPDRAARPGVLRVHQGGKA